MMNDFLGSALMMERVGRDNENILVDLTEIKNLMNGLTDRGITFKTHKMYGGMQIVCDGWDAICHMGSYGHSEGLLEIMGTIVRNDEDNVEGYLTADEILARL